MPMAPKVPVLASRWPEFISKLNSEALVRERTIPTERPPPVGEVSANFCGQRGVTWSAQRVPTAVNLCFLDVEPLLFFIQVAPQLIHAHQKNKINFVQRISEETHKSCPNRLKPSGNYIYHPIQHKELCILLTQCVCILRHFHNKYRKFPETA